MYSRVSTNVKLFFVIEHGFWGITLDQKRGFKEKIRKKEGGGGKKYMVIRFLKCFSSVSSFFLNCPVYNYFNKVLPSLSNYFFTVDFM